MFAVNKLRTFSKKKKPWIYCCFCGKKLTRWKENLRSAFHCRKIYGKWRKKFLTLFTLENFWNDIDQQVLTVQTILSRWKYTGNSHRTLRVFIWARKVQKYRLGFVPSSSFLPVSRYPWIYVITINVCAKQSRTHVYGVLCSNRADTPVSLMTTIIMKGIRTYSRPSLRYLRASERQRTRCMFVKYPKKKM